MGVWGEMYNFSMSLMSLEHGWANISIRDDVSSDTYMVSYVGPDALAGIVDTAIRLSRGQDSEIIFFLEPEKIPCWVKAQEDGTFLLSVQGLSFRGSSRRYIRQVLKMFDQYMHTYGESEYVKQWHHPYPSGKLEMLRMLLHSE